MTINKIGFPHDGNQFSYQGLSTDTKPTTGFGDGSTFLELDTGKFYVYDSKNLGTTQGWWYVCLLKIV